MLRRTPLRRKTWLRAVSRTKKYRRRERDIPHMLAVKKLPCCARELGPCCGPVEADHVGRRGIGMKCADTEVISICRSHHQQRHAFNGVFKGWDQQRMREWLTEQLQRTRNLLSWPGMASRRKAERSDATQSVALLAKPRTS